MTTTSHGICGDDFAGRVCRLQPGHDGYHRENLPAPKTAPSTAGPAVDARLAAIALAISETLVRVARADKQHAIARMRACNDPDERVMVPRGELESLETHLLWAKFDGAEGAWEDVRRWLGKPVVDDDEVQEGAKP